MFQSITRSDFHDAWNSSEQRKNSFSYNGLNALFSYLVTLEDDTGQPIELDIISLDCDYTEYKDLNEVIDNYSNIVTMEGLKAHTEVIEIPEGGLIIQNF